MVAADIIRRLKPAAITILFFSLFFSTFTVPVRAEDKVDVKGFLSIDKRFLVPETHTPIIDFYNNLQVEARAKPSDQVSGVASLDVRYYDYPRPANDLVSLEEINTSNPVEFSLWEGYIDVNGFLLKNLDLRVGKQRIAWGTADKLNQTDNLNPDDYSDPLDFGRKFPSTAFLATYYIKDWQLIGVWVPTIRPVLLPKSGFNLEALMPSNLSQLPGNVYFVPGKITTEYPSFTFLHSMGALKLKGQVLNTDFSVSYFHGYDDTPLPARLSNLTINLPEISADATMVLPHLDIVGLDLAGELFTVGFWAEATLLLPKNKIVLTETDQNTETLLEGFLTEKDRTILKKEPYVKYTLGGDYTFTNGIYLNCQYMHGFFTDAGVDNLGNYFIGRIEDKFLHDKIKTSLSGGLATMALTSQERFKDTLTYFLVPEIQYLGIDNLEITLGYFAIAGKKGTMFGSMTDQDQIYLKAKLSF
ncbi:MAG: hypothetical protein PHE84_02595 [bacterium]|nr:hypothetical protein [bacterium]